LLDGRIWGVGQDIESFGGVAYRIDPRAGSIETWADLDLHALDGIAIGGSQIWVTSNVTSDGECDGAGEDFTPRMHSVYVDGAPAMISECEGIIATMARLDSTGVQVGETMRFADWNLAGIAVSNADLWLSATDGERGVLARLRPGSDRFEHVRRTDDGMSLQLVAGFLWGSRGDHLYRLDPSTGAELARAELPGVHAIFIGHDDVWVATDNAVHRLDPATLQVRNHFPTPEPGGIVADASNVYITGLEDGHLYRLDPETGEVAERIDLGPHAEDSYFPATTDVVLAEGSAWVVHGAELVRIDLDSA